MSRELLVTPLAMIQPEPVTWAVLDQIPTHTITILAGAAGIAKSTILAHYIARWTLGRSVGDFTGPSPVAIINGEDDLARVLVPRLIAAGADLRHVHAIDGVRVTDENGETWVSSATLADDLPRIRHTIQELGVRVLIVDPIISLMSGDSHRLEDVRRNLDPLASMAADLGIAIVCVAHFNKGGGRAGEKVSGSHAFRDIARSLLVLAVDEETDDRILSVEKSNYSARKPSLAFSVESAAVPLPDGSTATVGRARLLGETSLTVQDLLNRDTSTLGDVSSQIVAAVSHAAEPVSAREVATEVGEPEDKVSRYLRRLTDSGRIQRAERGRFVPLGWQPDTETDTTHTASEVSELSESHTLAREQDVSSLSASPSQPDTPDR